MRTIRPFIFLLFLCGFAATIHSQPAPGGGYNQLYNNLGYPKGVKDAIEVKVTCIPTTNWTCTEMLVRVVDDKTTKIVFEKTIMPPVPQDFSESIPGTPGVKYRLNVYANFKNGTLLDFKDIEGYATPTEEAPKPPPGK